MAITYHVVVPFDLDDAGHLAPGQPIEAQSAESARRRAQALATRHAGAIAFSRTGDPDSGEFGDAVVLGEWGEVDRGMLGE